MSGPLRRRKNSPSMGRCTHPFTARQDPAGDDDAQETPRRAPESSGARRIGVTQLARAASMRIQLRRQRPSLLTQARCRAARRCATASWRLPALGRPMSED